MATLAILIGVYSYLVLALGLLGLLFRWSVFLVTLPFLVYGFYQFKKFNYQKVFEKVRQEAKKDRLIELGLLLLAVQVVVNLAGAFSPELSFDALFYHLPPPKLYATYHRIFHIPGGLLFVSALPRLTEMLYTVALVFGNEIWAKLIHFAFGILASIALFKLLRRYFSERLSVLGVLTFYTMLVVGWQSTTAYVELSRTFFEVLALFFFLSWVEEKKNNFLYEAAIMTGLAMATKILAFGTLFTFLILLFVLKRKGFLKKALFFGFLTILTVSPWLILSYVNTGDPLFPLFGGHQTTGMIEGGASILTLLKQRILKIPLFLWKATLYPDDILSPIYLLFLPLVLIAIWKQKLAIKLAALYVLLGAFFAPVESNRYLLPYLPGATLVTLSVFNYPWKRKSLEKFLIFLIFLGAILNLGSRGLATRKFIPYLTGKQTKKEFLTEHLNFDFGDFYDVDGWFAKNMTDEHLILIYDVHNLYYIGFPYAHESWAKPGTFFTHILVGDGKSLPEKFGKKPLIYENYKTRVKVYLFGEKLK